MLVALLSFNPDDESSVEQWVLAHSTDHDEIRQALLAQNIANLPNYVLYPINFREWDTFGQKHQKTHDEVNSVLNLPGQDLSTLDFENRQKFNEWHQQHFSEHLHMRDALGI